MPATWTPDWITAWATVGGTVIVALSAVVAIATLRRQAKDTEAATRPVLIAELRTSPILHTSCMLRVENYGQSPAYDVRVTLPHDLLRPNGDERLRGLAEMIPRRYAEPISIVPPRGVLANTYFVLDEGAADDADANKLPLPNELTVRIDYRAGNGRRARRYRDEFCLRMADVQAETVASPGDTTRDGLRMSRALEALARNLGSTK